MSYDYSSMSFVKSALGLLKNKAMMTRRKDAMERMGAAYMANGIVTLAGSGLYTSLADNDEVIADALNRFESVFAHVVNTGEHKKHRTTKKTPTGRQSDGTLYPRP